MLNNEQMAVAMGAVRDQMLAVVRDHELGKHGGRPCWGNRASTVAYLAHCLGIRDLTDPAWGYAEGLLAEYAEACDLAGGCGHHDEGEQ